MELALEIIMNESRNTDFLRERTFMLPYGHNSLRVVCDDRPPMVQLAPYTMYLLKRVAPDAELECQGGTLLRAT